MPSSQQQESAGLQHDCLTEILVRHMAVGTDTVGTVLHVTGPPSYFSDSFQCFKLLQQLTLSPFLCTAIKYIYNPSFQMWLHAYIHSWVPDRPTANSNTVKTCDVDTVISTVKLLINHKFQFKADYDIYK